MGTRRFEITIVSADNLPDVRFVGRMKVYAMVSLNGAMMDSTHTDRVGGTNPRWDSSFAFSIEESDLRRPGLNIVVELFCKRTLGDRFIGCTEIPVKSLFEKGLRSHRDLSYEITGAGSYGKLNIRYWFEEKYPPPPKRSESGGGGDMLWTAVRVAWALHTGDVSSFFT